MGSAKRRAQVGQKLQQIRSKINDLPVVASKYQVLIKGKGNFEKMWEWATTGNRSGAENWLPDIAQDETWDPSHKPDGLWYGEFLHRTQYRRNRQWAKTPGWWESLCSTYDQHSLQEPCDPSNEYDEWTQYASHSE